MTNDYWWDQRVADANFAEGQRDARAGHDPAFPGEFDYMSGYNLERMLREKS